jgi:hypothetical protein
MPPAFNITVNNKPVPMADHRATGLEIKKAAIAAGVEVEEDFQLSMERPNGELNVVDDDETITINKTSRFRAVAPDDNS